MIEREYYDENMQKHIITGENEEDVLRQIEAIRAKFRLNTKANDELIRKHEKADTEENINTKVDVFNDREVEKWADEFIAKDDLSYMTECHKRSYKSFLMSHKREANYSDHLCAVLALIDVHNMDALIDILGGGPQD